MARRVVEKDVDRDVVVERRGAGAGTTALTWLAMLLALIALGVAWAAYNRSGEDLESQIQQGVNEAAEETDERIDTENQNNSGDTDQNR